MKKRKVWLVNEYANLSAHGVSARPRAMARVFGDAGLETVVLLSRARSRRSKPSPTIQHIDIANISYRGNGVGRVVSMGLFGVGVLLRGMRVSRADRPDLIIGSSPHLFGAFAGAILARLWGIPFVLEVRDIWPLSVQEFFGLSSRHPLIQVLAFMEKYMYQHSAFMILLFAGAQRRVNSVIGRDVAFVEVPNGLDIDDWFYAEYEPPPLGQLKVVYTGAHGIPNSLHTVIEAAALVERIEPGIEIHLWGDGVEKKSLIELRDRLELRNVYFHAPVAKEQVAEILSAADVLIISQRDTDLYEYGLSPNKLSEYMGSGRPIINCIRSSRDPVTEAQAGWRVEPENPTQLAELLFKVCRMDRERLSEKARAARHYALMHYDWKRSVSLLVSKINESTEGVA